MKNRHRDEDWNIMRQYCDTTRRARGRAVGSSARASGFTLAELLISIGILGVGLTMSAALFPAGLEANKNSANDLLGTMICQNGLAMAKARVTTLHLPTIDCVELHRIDGLFTSAELKYPYGSDGNTAFFVLGRQIITGKNEYDLTVIAYQKHRDGGAVVLKDAQGDAYVSSTGVRQFTFDEGEGYAEVGRTIVIVGAVSTTAAGAYSSGSARIVSMNGKIATLDRALSGSNDRSLKVKIVYQEGVPTTPVMAVMSAHTSLPLK